MEERKAPDRTERIEQREIDPSAYSLSSSAKMMTNRLKRRMKFNLGLAAILTFQILMMMMNRFLFHETDLNSDNDEEQV